ncbi:hypothetical protein BH09ACT7_BH09ACT7_44890 [soil metagenome]
MTVVQWWRSGPTRLRWRRRLLLFSAPVALIVVVVIVKLISVVVAGGSASSAYADRDSGRLRSAAESLAVLNVVQPAKAYFAAGALAVLDNRLDDADHQFTESLARSDATESCPVRVNLALVRETLGDRAAAAFDGPTAVARYLSARTVVEQASQGCFAANTDPNPERRALRDDTLPRLDAKIAASQGAPPPPPPPPGAVAPPPPPPPAVSGATPEDSDPRLRLNPGVGPPQDRLQQILRDAAAAQGG